MKVSLATEMAPPFVLVAHFFIAAVIFLILSALALPFLVDAMDGYVISPSLAAFSHLYLLGFVMMVIFGAMYQLLPVVLEAPIFSKDFAYVQFYMYIVGLSMMVCGFAFGSLYLLIPYGAVITYSAMLIFCINVFLTFFRLESITLVGKFLLVATFFLFISVTMGLIIGLSLGHGLFSIDVDAWVRAHMVGTLGGFVMMVVMGVAMVLLPMFSLAHGYSQKWIESAFYVHSISIIAVMVCLITGYERFVMPLSLFIIFALVLFIIQVVVILKSRVRKQNDYWVKNIIFALVGLTSALVVVWFNLFLAGILFFFGFLLPFIVGHMYKILPFLVWYEKFSPLVGKQKVPLLHQMIHTNVADVQTWMLFVAVFILSTSMLVASQMLFLLGSSVLFSSVILVIYNVYYTFNYKIKE